MSQSTTSKTYARGRLDDRVTVAEEQHCLNSVDEDEIFDGHLTIRTE